jgi:hypothetical protein
MTQHRSGAQTVHRVWRSAPRLRTYLLRCVRARLPARLLLQDGLLLPELSPEARAPERRVGRGERGLRPCRTGSTSSPCHGCCGPSSRRRVIGLALQTHSRPLRAPGALCGVVLELRPGASGQRKFSRKPAPRCWPQARSRQVNLRLAQKPLGRGSFAGSTRPMPGNAQAQRADARHCADRGSGSHPAHPRAPGAAAVRGYRARPAVPRPNPVIRYGLCRSPQKPRSPRSRVSAHVKGCPTPARAEAIDRRTAPV